MRVVLRCQRCGWLRVRDQSLLECKKCGSNYWKVIQNQECSEIDSLRKEIDELQKINKRLAKDNKSYAEDWDKTRIEKYNLYGEIKRLQEINKHLEKQSKFHAKDWDAARKEKENFLKEIKCLQKEIERSERGNMNRQFYFGDKVNKEFGFLATCLNNLSTDKAKLHKKVNELQVIIESKSARPEADAKTKECLQARICEFEDDLANTQALCDTGITFYGEHIFIKTNKPFLLDKFKKYVKSHSGFWRV